MLKLFYFFEIRFGPPLEGIFLWHMNGVVINLKIKYHIVVCAEKGRAACQFLPTEEKAILIRGGLLKITVTY